MENFCDNSGSSSPNAPPIARLPITAHGFTASA
jgi:hypothetical protein